MNLIAIADLKQPRRLKQRLREERELLLTSDGRPVAVIAHVGADDDPELMLRLVRDARSRLALSRVGPDSAGPTTYSARNATMGSTADARRAGR